MTKPVKVKICGLTLPYEIRASEEAGANYIGFVFYLPSRRNLTITQAEKLVSSADITVQKVALTVNATNQDFEKIISAIQPNWLQLHGQESPKRVEEIRSKFDLPIIKACGVKTKDDVKRVKEFFDVSDQLLIDAKPISSQGLPGGNGLSFDWKLVKQFQSPLPWMLAGGLNVHNVRKSIEMTGVKQVDVSSGVENTSGQKSVESIKQFIQAAKGLKDDNRN